MCSNNNSQTKKRRTKAIDIKIDPIKADIFPDAPKPISNEKPTKIKKEEPKPVEIKKEEPKPVETKKEELEMP